MLASKFYDQTHRFNGRTAKNKERRSINEQALLFFDCGRQFLDAFNGEVDSLSVEGGRMELLADGGNRDRTPSSDDAVFYHNAVMARVTRAGH